MKKEFFRKFFHLFFGTLFLLLIYYFGTENSLIIISGLFLIGLILALIVRSGYKNKFIKEILEIVERDHEKHFPGKAALLFFLSAIILLYFFRNDTTIVIASLSLIIFADLSAAVIGKLFGKRVILNKKHYKKTLEGTIACFLVSLIILLFVVPIPIAILIAMISTLIEFLPINDNLAMPLVAAILLKLLI